MASIVLDLQKEILSSNCDIVNVLRKSHLAAVKLKLSDFDQWIPYELNRYTNKESCPEYRKDSYPSILQRSTLMAVGAVLIRCIYLRTNLMKV